MQSLSVSTLEIYLAPNSQECSVNNIRKMSVHCPGYDRFPRHFLLGKGKDNTQINYNVFVRVIKVSKLRF